MSDYTSGKELKSYIETLRNKTNDMMDKSRQALSPLLDAQNKTLSETKTITSLITDINKLDTIENCVSPYEDLALTESHSNLFANSIIPSNAIIVSESRIILVDDGLLYLIDYDADLMKITNRSIHKMDGIWDICKDGAHITLVKGSDNTTPYIWLIPEYTDHLIMIYGDGLITEGELKYRSIPLPRECQIRDFKDSNHSIGMITDQFAFYFINNFNPLTDFFVENWEYVHTMFEMTCICDGNIYYLGAVKGEIYHLNTNSYSFEYVIDIYNERDYDAHFDAWYDNRDAYNPIIAMNYNRGRWTIVEKGNRLFSYAAWDELDTTLSGDLVSLELPADIYTAHITANKASSYDRIIIYGLDSELNAVAYSYRTSYEGIEKMDIDIAGVPQFTFIDIHYDRAVMLNLYEKVIAVEDYYDQDYIDEMVSNGTELSDLSHITLGMRVAAYEDFRYNFGSEFTPNFIPNCIVSGEDASIITGKCLATALYNIAITADQERWFFINIDPTIAINVQSIAYGNNTYVMCGLDTDHILISRNGYDWKGVMLPSGTMNLVSVTFNQIRNKFYIINHQGTMIISYDCNTQEITEIPILIDSIEKIIKITNLYHNIVITYETSDSVRKSCMTISNEYDINITNEFKDVSLYGLDGYVSDTMMLNDTTYMVFTTTEAYYDIEYSDIRKDAIIQCILQIPKTDPLFEQNVQIVDSSISHRYLDGFYNDTCNIAYFCDSVILSKSNDLYYLLHNDYRAPYDYITLCGKYRYIGTVCKQIAVHNNHIHKIHSIRDQFKNISYLMTSVEKEPMVRTSDVASNYMTSILYPYDIIEVTPPSDNTYTMGDKDTISIKISDQADEAGSIIYGDRYIKLNPNSRYGYMSEDGVSWIPLMLPNNRAGVWKDIAYGNGTYVILQYSNNLTSHIYFSNEVYPDQCTNWLSATIPSGTSGWYEVEYESGIFLSIATPSANMQGYIYSIDGSSWTWVGLDNTPTHIHRYIGNEICPYLLITTNGPAYLIDCANPTNPIKFYDPSSGSLQYKDMSLPLIQKLIGDNIYDNIFSPCHAIVQSIDQVSFIGKFDISTGTVESGDIQSIATLSENLNISRIYSFTDSNDYLISVYYDSSALNRIYILIDNFIPNVYVANEKTIKNLIIVDLPESINCDFGHPICYRDGKLLIGMTRTITIDMLVTIPSVVEGSFFIKAGDLHNQSLPFTPDHVFLFNGNSIKESSKFLLSEIHRDTDISLDGTSYRALTFFDNGGEVINHRVDSIDQIVTNGFIFMNETMNDRYINFTAIKENQYS